MNYTLKNYNLEIYQAKIKLEHVKSDIKLYEYYIAYSNAISVYSDRGQNHLQIK